MRGDGLLILGRFANDAESVLAAVQQLALVRVKGGLDGLAGIGLELRVAALTDADHRQWLLFHDSQLALGHDRSLTQSGDVPHGLWKSNGTTT